MSHASDCAQHNLPASPVGDCDCGEITIIPPGGIIEHAGWQPIETAPMDGTEVILFYQYYVDEGFVTAGYWSDKSQSHEPHWYADLVNGGASDPTHWMPLPSPPKLEG